MKKLIYSAIFPCIFFVVLFATTGCSEEPPTSQDSETIKGNTLQEKLDNGLSIERALQTYPVDSLYGKFYQGGFVFYVNTTDFTGMVISPTNIKEYLYWHFNEDKTGATDTTFGAGESNTSTIISVVGTDTFAAQVCSDLELNGYSDWYLPSLGELDVIRLNLYNKKLGNLSPFYYWSSSEGNKSFHAWMMYLPNGNVAQEEKRTNRHVRAVRNF